VVQDIEDYASFILWHTV